MEEEEEHGEPYAVEEGEEQDDAKEDIVRPAVREDQNAQPNEDLVKETMIFPNAKGSAEQEVVATPQGPNEKYSKGHDKIPKPKGHSEQKSVAQRTVVAAPIEQGIKDSKGWQAIPKPKDTRLWTMHGGIKLKMTLVMMMMTTVKRSLSLNTGSG